MVANLCLFTCAVLTAQSADHLGWSMLPRLGRGEELVYRGTFTEEALGPAVQFSRVYRLEGRVFVLDTPPDGLDVAFYTVLRPHSPTVDRGEGAEPNSVRLELARVDLQGRITPSPGVVLAVPLEGPATVECGAFVEVPRGHIASKQVWEVTDGNRPSRIWRALGTETISGTLCLKLEAVQQSADWDRPRADHTAWRRRDVVWFAPRLGVAYRVERVIERREAARREPSQRSVTRYELASDLQYPGQLFEDRRREIRQARAFADALAPLLPSPAMHGPSEFDALLSKIAHHVERQSPTPYREAVLQVKRRAEAARRGESPPLPPVDEADEPAAGLAVGRTAPGFLTTNLLTGESVASRRWLGQPVLMVFYSPTSASAEQVLRFAQRLQSFHGRTLAVLGFAVTEDPGPVRRQHTDFGLTFPLLSGNGLRLSYGVDATPKLVVVDGDGVVRANYSGWGPETAGAVTEEIQRWLRPGQPGPFAPGGKDDARSSPQRRP